MLEYRRFRLINGKNQIYELTDKNHKVYANNPNGLGYSRTLSVFRLGDENLITYSMINLDNVNFEILFYDDNLGDKYQKYREFVNFLSFKPLYLLYQAPNSFTWYRRQVESMSLSKSEVDYDDRMLHCNFVLQALAFWEDNEKNVIETNNDLNGGKIYPINYPINYGFNNLSNVNLTSVGLLDAPLEITINGNVTNPGYVLYDSNGNIYGRTRFIGEFDSVYVNSKETEEEVRLVRNGLILDNPLGYQDLTIGSANEIYITFLKLQVGKSKMAFFLGSGFAGTVKVEWRNRYATI